MGLAQIFTCDKCKKTWEIRGNSDNGNPIHMIFRYSKGFADDQYGKNIKAIWCTECFNTLGIDIKEPASKILPNHETIEDKLIYILEELGFSRGEYGN